ncbi:MAG TPA: PDZ domain-containing protein [Fimbriiglobus sp.]|nr:PDZ domain-containing protein [Fimbriiglobus sp.]
MLDAAISHYDTYELFSKGVGFRRVSSGELPGETIGRVFAHSLTFSTEVSQHKSKWVCLVGDRLTETNRRSRGWYDATLAVNNSVEMSTRFLYTSLLIADGDVELRPQPGGGNISLDGSVIIARGSIRAKEPTGVGRALLCAGGDITAGGLHGGSQTYLYASGRVRLGKVGAANPAAGKPVVKEGADLSFTGVRFFKLSDVGVEAAADKAGVRITKLDPRSPLAFYGLKAGDVITKLNDQPMTSVNEFRRHARRSVVLRAGIFHVRRGDETLSRIVYFDGLLAARS